MSLLCDAIRRDVLDASSEDSSDNGRDSAYALEGSQAIEELEKPEDLISALSNEAHNDTLFSITEEESSQQSVDFSNQTVTIDPILLNPPQFIERNGKLLLTTMAPNEVTTPI